MKAILEFDLSDPDDKREHTRMLKALDLQLCLLDISSKIREQVKYADLTDEQHAVWREISEIFYRAINDREIDLDL